jgi:tetratricopeptide (TPR) repeat protein
MEIFERLGDTVGQASVFGSLAWLLHSTDSSTPRRKLHLTRSNSLPEKGQEFQVCQSHRVLGRIYRSKGEREKAIHHFETALGIASNFNWRDQLFWNHYSWHSCFATKASSTMHRLTSNKPSRTQMMAHTIWVARWRCRLDLVSTIQARRGKIRGFCAQRRSTRSSGQ